MNCFNSPSTSYVSMPLVIPSTVSVVIMFRNRICCGFWRRWKLSTGRYYQSFAQKRKIKGNPVKTTAWCFLKTWIQTVRVIILHEIIGDEVRMRSWKISSVWAMFFSIGYYMLIMSLSSIARAPFFTLVYDSCFTVLDVWKPKKKLRLFNMWRSPIPGNKNTRRRKTFIFCMMPKHWTYISRKNDKCCENWT